MDFHNSRAYQLDWLKSQGFEVVEHYVVEKEELEAEVIKFSEKIKEFLFVLLYYIIQVKS